MLRQILLFLFAITIIGYPHAFVIARDANDQFITEAYHLDQIDAKEAWDYSIGSREVVIAIIDTGVDIDHPDLKANIWRNTDEIPNDKIDNDNNGYVDDVQGWDFLDNNNNPRPKIKTGFTEGAVVHGTIVAGAAGAIGNNEIGSSGVAWDVSLMPLRALDHTGSGITTDVVTAIEYAVANGADIINLSFVAVENDWRLFEAVEHAYNNNVAVVAAAGNENDDHTTTDLSLTPHFPICYSGNKGENYVVGVAGINEDETKGRYSNFGSDCIDISAPGTRIPTTSYFQPAFEDFRKQYTDAWSGTSLATPLVSGSLALLKSVRPDIPMNSLVEVLLSTTEDINFENPEYIGKLGSGRLSIGSALSVVTDTKVISPVIPSTTNEALYTLTRVDDVTSQYKVWDIAGIEQHASIIKHPFTFDSFIVSDVDGDGFDEIIIGAAKGEEPRVSIYNAETGILEQSFLVYPSVFKGGLSVTVADTNGTGLKEIFVVPKTGGTPQVLIFNHLGGKLASFFAGELFGYSDFEIIAGDIPSIPGLAEILIIARNSNKAVVYGVDGFVKENITFGTIFNTATSVQLHGPSETIFFSSGKGLAPLIQQYYINGLFKKQYFAYGENFKGGVSLGVLDVNGDGSLDVVSGAGPTGGPHVRVFTEEGVLIGQFFAQSQTYNNGVVIGSKR